MSDSEETLIKVTDCSPNIKTKWQGTKENREIQCTCREKRNTEIKEINSATHVHEFNFSIHYTLVLQCIIIYGQR